MDQDTKMQGRGATPHADGVAFRVWAPYAQRVAVKRVCRRQSTLRTPPGGTRGSARRWPDNGQHHHAILQNTLTRLDKYSVFSLIQDYCGISGVCLSLPAALDQGGVEWVLPLALNSQEANAMY